MDHAARLKEHIAASKRLANRTRGITTPGTGYLMDVQSFEASGLYWVVTTLLSAPDHHGLESTPSDLQGELASILVIRAFQIDLGQPHLLGDGAQLIAELEHAGGSSRGVDAEAGDDHFVERGGNAGIYLEGRSELSILARLEDTLLSEASREHPIHGGAQVVNVGLLVDHLFIGLLGRDVLGG